MRGSRLMAIALTTAALLVAGCAGDSDTTTSTASSVTGQTTAITIDEFSFDPHAVQVDIGDSVTWTNVQSVAHTTTARNGGWDSSSLQTGSDFTLTLDAAGTFEYFCSIHPSMSGTIEVSG